VSEPFSHNSPQSVSIPERTGAVSGAVSGEAAAVTNIRPVPERLTFSQQQRLSQFSATRCVDLHCHCLPGIDDGPRSMIDALALCRQFVRDGFTDVIATPHQLGRWDGANRPDQIRAAITELQHELDSLQIPLNVYVGGEVRVDERLSKLIEADGICTMADAKKYMLVELPSTGLMSAAVIAKQLEPDHNAASDWLDAGAVLQINAGSLLGAFGKPSMDAAWDWLSSGWISLVATDSHGTGSRRPRMSEAIDLIVRELGEEVAKTVCIDNPCKVLLGEELAPL
jgi:protein-tyrosine phosphatase